jgi:hypothetical protein|tara:strand:+ start:750 stop:1019 length:270 start_codon:yes stop_codon:yes gene_type:complete
MSLLAPHFSDNQIAYELLKYDEVAFCDVPRWLREQVIARDMHFPRREPTELEMWETVADAREHRITNNELTIQDYLDHYKYGKSFTIGA